jgi:FAD/FMN-containing dehydrogenase
MHLGGAAREVGADESAAGNRDAAYIVNVAGAWDDPAEDDVHQGWVRGCWEAVREFSTGGTYLNFLTEDDGRDDARKRASWDESTYRRLVELKDRYDPFNVFRSNMNIPPSKTAWDLRGS